MRWSPFCFTERTRDVPVDSPDGLNEVLDRDFVRVRSVASTEGYPVIGPSAVSGAFGLLAMFLSNRVLYTPVYDAIALGTFRTRLETRTKESSMCASHWDLINLKA